MNLVETITAQYRDFTANEKRICNLMNEDVKTFALSSIGEIATRLGISKTTLMRFAKSCGFKGYADFKRALQREVLLETSPVRKMTGILSGKEAFRIEELREQELLNINKTFESLSEEDLNSLGDLLCGRKEVHTLSWGISTSIAEIFALRMKLMGIRCTSIQRKHGTLIEESALVTDKDLLFVFEIPPYNREMIEAVGKLAEKGVTIVLITDSPRCPLTDYSDLSFYCATNARFFGNSLTGPLFWVNMVSSLIICREKERVMSTLEEQQKIFNDPRYYHQ